MAQAFPIRQFYGFDFHQPFIDRARKLAAKAGINNVTFKVATAKAFSGSNYDLVTIADCLRDLGDPVGAVFLLGNVLNENGTLMIVEPAARDALEENLHPVGRIDYAFSAALCVPSPLD